MANAGAESDRRLQMVLETFASDLRNGSIGGITITAEARYNNQYYKSFNISNNTQLKIVWFRHSSCVFSFSIAEFGNL